jgi:TPR repeat protein
MSVTTLRPRRFVLILFAALSMLRITSGTAWAAAGDYAPENIVKTEGYLGWMCTIHPLCPVSDKVHAVIKRAIANDRSGQYLLGLTLLTGDGLPMDRDAGVVWVARAAEQGEPGAARDIAGRLRNGASIKVDERKIAAALQPQADAGDVEAMRALSPMVIGGRGTKQDAALGVALLTRAVAKGSAGAEQDLSQLYLNGAPGVPANRPEAMRWLAMSAGHGNVDAMTNLGYMTVNASIRDRDLASGFCWLMRAALLDQVQAQEKLTSILTDGEKDDHGTVIAADLVQADFWFRLAARSPYHDNSQIRSSIEPKMTTDQMDEAKRLFDAWHAKTLAEVKAMTIALPVAPPRACPAMT